MIYHSMEELVREHRKAKETYVREPSCYAVEPFQIFGPVWYVGDQDVCLHLIDTGDGLILIDAGYPHTIHLTTESIWHLGFDPKDIRLIIITHAHYDHIGCAMEYKRLYGCELAMSRVDTELMEAHPDLLLRNFSELEEIIEVPEIDRKLEDGEHVRMGNIDIECRLIPGHTPGAMAFFFRVTEDGQKYYRAGLFGGAGIGSVRRVSLEYQGFPLSLQQDMLDSLTRMADERVELFLGNHEGNNHTLKRREEQLAGNHEAFIRPGGWKAFLMRQKVRFEQTFAEERAYYGN